MTMPTVTIAADNVFAVPVIEHLRTLCLAAGLKERADEAGAILDEFRDWQLRNVTRIDVPASMRSLVSDE